MGNNKPVQLVNRPIESSANMWRLCKEQSKRNNETTRKKKTMKKTVSFHTGKLTQTELNQGRDPPLHSH